MVLSVTSTVEDIMAHLASIASDEERIKLTRYGIDNRRAFGISHGRLRKLPRELKRNHARAMQLFATGNREAQHLAAWTADPKLMTLETARLWASDFSSWDTVDGVSDFFIECHWWLDFIRECALNEAEFVKRTAFAMTAWAFIHRKLEPDETFIDLLELVERHANDDRNFVKKSVSWALRCIGKRSLICHSAANTLAEQLQESDVKSARWIGKDAFKDLATASTAARIARISAKQEKNK